MITIDNGNKLPKCPLAMCETLEEAELICLPDHEIYALDQSCRSGKYKTYFVEAQDDKG